MNINQQKLHQLCLEIEKQEEKVKEAKQQHEEAKAKLPRKSD